MKYRLRIGLALALAVAGVMLCPTLPARAQAALTISGVTDKSTYTDTVTLQVPSAAGYTYVIRLNGEPIPTDAAIVVNKMDYHELSVTRTNTATMAVTNRLVRFIVISSQRGAPEKGLMAWVPYPPINSTAAEFAGAELQLMLPAAYPQGLPIPVIARVADAQDRERRGNGWITAAGFETSAIQVMRGHGSGFLPPATAAGTLNYNAQLTTLTANKQILIDDTTAWTSVGGLLTGSNVWAANSRIFVSANLTLATNAVLTIEAGTIVKLNPLVNITNSGTILINGLTNQPVVFTATNVVWPEVRAGAWGGFLLRGSNAKLIANGAIMAGGGGAATFSFSPGASHRDEQAVLLVHSGAQAYLTNCAIINTCGQVANGYNCVLVVDHSHWQRAITGGEYSGSSGDITFNHSAAFEFPNDDGVLNATIVNDDYDGLYFTEGRHVLMNSLVGFAKDDALDSGSGNAGTMWVSNCWVESAQHEAHAWSGDAGRRAWSFDTVLINSGQGIEAGWGRATYPNPDVFADRLLSTANSVGARFGDNYDWDYHGFMRLTNSLLLHNYRDIFLKTWNGVASDVDTNSWVDRVLQVDFRSNLVTTVDAQLPGNLPWDPTADGWRLAAFMSTPPEAAVGVGLALRTNQFTLATLFNGVPVRLSTFTTNTVTVQYELANATATLATGELVFTPGETVKFIYPAGFDLTTNSSVQVRLTAATGGEVTGLASAVYNGTVTQPTVQLSVATNQFSAWRLAEGPFLSLSGPSALPVSVDYTLADTNGVVESGTVVIPPNTLRVQLFPATISPFEYARLDLTLANATNASLVGTTAVTYTYTVVPLTLALGVTNQQDLAIYAAGVPITLNAPAVSGVTVQFAVTGNRSGATNGTLAFAVGAVSAQLLTPTVDAGQNDFIQITLANAAKATFTGPDTVYYVKVTPTPVATNTTLVARGATTIWRYRDVASDPGADWKLASYDASGAPWKSGGAQLGFGESDQTTAIASNRQTTTYFRYYFNVADPEAYASLNLWLLRDDGGVVHLNGREVFRSPNLPAPPTAINYGTWTLSGQNGDNTIDTAVVSATNLIAGTNLVAVEIHQAAVDSSDLSFDFELVGVGKPPAVAQPVYQGRLGGNYTLAWGDPAFKLLEATNLLGPWMTNPANGTFTTLPTNREAYYRLVKP